MSSPWWFPLHTDADVSPAKAPPFLPCNSERRRDKRGGGRSPWNFLSEAQPQLETLPAPVAVLVRRVVGVITSSGNAKGPHFRKIGQPISRSVGLSAFGSLNHTSSHVGLPGIIGCVVVIAASSDVVVVVAGARSPFKRKNACEASKPLLQTRDKAFEMESSWKELGDALPHMQQQQQQRFVCV